MNFVEPIRDRKKIAQIKSLLRGQHRFFATTQAVIIGMIFGAGLGAAVGSLKTQAFNSFWSSTQEKWPVDSYFLAFSFSLRFHNLFTS